MSIAAAFLLLAAVPPGFTMERTGHVDDFAYFEGGWSTVQHREITAADGTKSWSDFPATLCAQPYLKGNATVDELWMPQQKRSGLTLRLFDQEKRQWSVYWVNSVTGRLDPIPVVGGFDGPRGEFYAHDTVNGKPVKVRYLWTLKDRDHARWEQALSYDDKTWETNWTADFTRGDAAKLCRNGKPVG